MSKTELIREFYTKNPGLQSGPLIYKNALTPLGTRVVKKWQKFVPEQGLWLDAGCGKGELSDFLTTHFSVDFVTTDISPVRDKDLQADLHQLPFPAEHFDGILLSDVFEHLESPRQVLTELFRVMKPDAILIIFSPSYQNMTGVLKQVLEGVGVYQSNSFAPFQRWKKQAHESLIKVKSVKKLLINSQYEVLVSRTYWNLDGCFPFMYLLPDFLLYGPVFNVLRFLTDCVPTSYGLYFTSIAKKR